MILEDFYKEVLQKLGTLAAEETPSASDRKAVKDKYEQVHAKLSRRNIGVVWFDDDDIPDWIADGFASIVAWDLKSKFSLPQNKVAELREEMDDAMTTLIGDGQYRETPAADVEYM